MELAVSAKQRRALTQIVAQAMVPAQEVRRAQVILWSADGVLGVEIARRLHVSVEAVSRIRRRFTTAGVDGSDTTEDGRKDHAVPAATVERLVELAMSPPPPGRSRWTTRLLAKEVDLTSGCVSDVLRRHGLKPHHERTYKVSHDPAFVAKGRDIVGLYLHPPTHAVVLSMDEKTSIQALERTQPPLPLRKGRAARHTQTTSDTASSTCTRRSKSRPGTSRIASPNGILRSISVRSCARSCGRTPIRSCT